MLSELIRQERLLVVESLEAGRAEDPAAGRPSSRSWASSSVLIVIEAYDEKTVPGRAQPAARGRAARRPRSTRSACCATSKVLMTVAALRRLEEKLA